MRLRKEEVTFFFFIISFWSFRNLFWVRTAGGNVLKRALVFWYCIRVVLQFFIVAVYPFERMLCILEGRLVKLRLLRHRLPPLAPPRALTREYYIRTHPSSHPSKL